MARRVDFKSIPECSKKRSSSVATKAFIKLSGRSLNLTGVLFSKAYFPSVFPSIEITSEAKFFSGFSNSSNVGSVPNTPQEANKNTSIIVEIPPKIAIQNHFIYLEN